MRLFEIILVAALFLSMVCSLLSMSLAGVLAATLVRISIGLLIVAAVALAIHLAVEQAHWQMAPAYAAFVPVGLLAWFAIRPRTGMVWPWSAVALLLLVACCACSYVAPMFRLPMPTGRYAIGTTVLYMADPSRAADGSVITAALSGGAKRELVVQLWYPAMPGQGRFASYRRKVETTLESSYQAVLPTNSSLDASVQKSDTPYPVLLFNPAWRGRRTQDTFLTEELASHGYVVAAVDHTYNSTPVAMPDGRVITAEVTPAIESLIHTTPEEVERIGTVETDKEALDDRFVLDELERLNQQQGSRWFQTMNVANAGAFGHSLGGAVSVATWATDPRVHAAMNMDGWTFGTQAALAQRSVGGPGVKSPLLFLYEDGYYPDAGTAKPQTGAHGWNPQTIEAAVDVWDKAHVARLIERYGGYWLVLKGAIHPTFTDKIITSPIRRLSGVGSLPAERAHSIVRAYAVQFFDQALKNKPSPLLDGSQTKYPEVVTSLSVAAPAVSATLAAKP